MREREKIEDKGEEKGEEKNFTPVERNVSMSRILYGLDYFYWPVNPPSVDTVNLCLRPIITTFS